MYTTPILLITFNRPTHVKNALQEIRKQQPRTLYVFQDGPRATHPDDTEKLQKVRDLIDEMVDWKCDIKLNYQKQNLGCGRGPYEAMSWFFRNVEMGIILEDDVVPHPLFFAYMKELLERYKDDQQIGFIAGHNINRRYSQKNSYYFTFETEGTLGWGTWRRTWMDMNFDVQYDYNDFESAMKKYGMPLFYRKSEHQKYQEILSKDRHDHWDYQIEYCLRLKGYINIKPNSCLTSHEGVDEDATHSGFTNPNYKMEVNEDLFTSINHPEKVQIDKSEYIWLYKRNLKLFVKNILNKIL